MKNTKNELNIREINKFFKDVEKKAREEALQAIKAIHNRNPNN